MALRERGTVEGTLFDRDGEPADQPRHLVQVLGIMLFNGLREPTQTFVVAQGRDMSLGTIEGTVFIRSVAMAGMESASVNPATRKVWPNESIWRPGHDAGGWPNCTVRLPIVSAVGPKTPANRCGAEDFPAHTN